MSKDDVTVFPDIMIYAMQQMAMIRTLPLSFSVLDHIDEKEEDRSDRIGMKRGIRTAR